MTAIVTFLATQAAGWVFSRAADSLATATTPVLHVDSSGPIATPWDVTIPQRPDEVDGTLVQAENIAQWATNQGGGPSTRVRIELRIGANRDYAIVLEGIRASEVECEPAPSWTEVRATVGGEISMRKVSIDLDSGNHEAVPQADPAPGDAFSFPLQVSKTELEFFTVEVASARASCTFRLDIRYRDGDKELTHQVDNGGQPFRVVSPDAAVDVMEWRLADDGRWTPARPGR